MEDFEPLAGKIDKVAKKKLVRQHSLVRREKKAREDKKTTMKWKFTNPADGVEERYDPCFEENSARLESEAPLSSRAVDILKGTHLDLANSFERDFAKPIEGDLGNPRAAPYVVFNMQMERLRDSSIQLMIW